MSYKYETQYTSPNATPNHLVYATWGRPRTIDAIAIHHWGDPATNPTYEGVINWLLNPASQASAHFVITGTGRRAAQLVDFDSAAWATNSANPYTVALELDPRARDEDYDVAAEVIAQIWDAFGYKPLVPHKQFASTACPGAYDLARLEAIAKTKDGSGDWGHVTNKNAPAPKPQPKPEPVHDNLYRLFVGGNQVAAYSVDKNAYNGYVNYGSTGNITYKGEDVTKKLVDKFKPAPEPEPEPKPEPQPEEPKPENPSEDKSPLASFIRAVKEFLKVLVDLWNAKY